VCAVRKPAGFGVRVMLSGRRLYFARFRKGSDFARRRRMTALESCWTLPLCAESDQVARLGTLEDRATTAADPTGAISQLSANLCHEGAAIQAPRSSRSLPDQSTTLWVNAFSAG